MPPYRLTTWYYVLGIDDALHRVPARLPEEILLGSEAKAGPPRLEWVHDFGGVILVGALLALRTGKPVAFVGMGMGLLSVTPACPQTLLQDHWERLNLAERLARTAGHRAGVQSDRIAALTDYFLYHVMNLPVAAAKMIPDMGLHGILYNWNHTLNAGGWDRWEIATGQMAPGTRE